MGLPEGFSLANDNMTHIKENLNFFISYQPISHGFFTWLTLNNFVTADQFFCQLPVKGWTSGAIAAKGVLNSNFGGGLVHITAN